MEAVAAGDRWGQRGGRGPIPLSAGHRPTQGPDPHTPCHRSVTKSCKGCIKYSLCFQSTYWYHTSSHLICIPLPLLPLLISSHLIPCSASSACCWWTWREGEREALQERQQNRAHLSDRAGAFPPRPCHLAQGTSHAHLQHLQGRHQVTKNFTCVM